MVDLGCEQPRNILELVNVRDSGRAAKNFRLSSASSPFGPWTTLITNGSVNGSSGAAAPAARSSAPEVSSGPAPQMFFFQPTEDQFFRFELLDWEGVGGGLQFFSVTGWVFYH